MPTTKMVAEGDWLHRADGTARRTSNAKKMRRVKPAVDQIKNSGSVEEQAAALRAVIDHHDLAAARQHAGIDSSNDTIAVMASGGSMGRLGWISGTASSACVQ